MNKSEHHKNWVHGQEPKRLYNTWCNMRRRCYEKQNHKYKNYGGRGIKICPEWLDFCVFREWALSNGYSETLTLDRINVNGNYEPTNCRWVTQKIQQNNRSNNHLITYNGETHTMKEWSEITGISYRTIKDREYRNLPAHLVLCKESGVKVERTQNPRFNTP